MGHRFQFDDSEFAYSFGHLGLVRDVPPKEGEVCHGPLSLDQFGPKS